jgi:hypothetical protein
MRVTIRDLMSPREERAIRNEELFREVNAHIAELEDRSRDLNFGEPLPLVCECSRTGCTAPIAVDPSTFDRVRDHPLQFLVAHGHEEVELETVIETKPDYLVVEKHRP